MNIVFFGTSAFAARVLQGLIQKHLPIVAIVTRPDKPKGRSLNLLPPPVKEEALKLQLDIPIYQPIKASTPEFAQTLKNHNPSLFVIVAYGEIIKTLLLDIPTKGCINVHASLLPKYRGASPIQRCLMHGETETGITIMQMVLEMDAGDMLSVVKTPISSDMTFGELDQKLSEIATPALLKVIDQIERGTAQAIPQDHTHATFAPKLSAQEEEIHWEKSAEELHNLIRALSPFPGAWCSVQIGSEKKRLKIKLSKVEPSLHGKPGEVLSHSKQDLVIACGKDSLRLLQVQLEGKKLMTVKEFLQGLHSLIIF
ncbi:MAG: methionyl-tRNA formyltransferase [Rhabdochlamydiaceae bacterium]|jgi:methionyl-tRNA formyltransferase